LMSGCDRSGVHPVNLGRIETSGLSRSGSRK
jgi:hypothetical protein